MMNIKRYTGMLILAVSVFSTVGFAKGAPAQDAYSVKGLVNKFMVDIWSEGNMSAISDILPENFEFNLSFARTTTRESFRNMVINNRTVFQGLTYEPVDIIVDGQKAACRWKMHAKHIGTWRNIPGSNKDVAIEGITFFETDGGKITRAFVQNDVHGLMTQIASGGGRTEEETRNVALVTAYINDILIKRDFATFSTYAAPDFHIDRSAVPEGITGEAGLSTQMDMLYNAFPDMELRMADVVAEGDKVLVRFEGPGTQTGEFAGIPATNKKATWKGLVLYKVTNGKLVHAWAVWDDYGLLMQLKN